MADEILTIHAVTAEQVVAGESYIAVRCDEKNEMTVFTFRVLTAPRRDPDPNEQTFEARCLTVNGKPFAGEDADTVLSLSDIGCPRKGTPKGICCRTFPYSKLEDREVVLQMLLSFTQNNASAWHNIFKGKKTTMIWTKGRRFELADNSDASVLGQLTPFTPRKSELGLSVLVGMKHW